jgi:gas vesicle protein
VVTGKLKFSGVYMAIIKEQSLGKLNCFLIGIGCGALVALLFAPKPGKDLRTDISVGAKRGVNLANNSLAQVKQGAANFYTAGVDGAAGLIGAGKEMIGTQKDIVAAALAAGKNAYQASKDGQANNKPTENNNSTL